jgi:hypothetical protein
MRRSAHRRERLRRETEQQQHVDEAEAAGRQGDDGEPEHAEDRDADEQAKGQPPAADVFPGMGGCWYIRRRTFKHA